jgi:hypothetical protein
MSHDPGRPPEERRWLDDSRNVSRLFRALVGVCALLVAIDVATLHEKHGHFAFEELPGFHAAFGFAAYVGLVLTAKALRRFLKRDEDYYGD